eukprot:2374636-Rhodomonas_salina.1
MSNWRPVCLLRTAYKVASTVINDRLATLFKEYGILELQQEGNQLQHSTIRQVSWLLHVIADAKRTGSQLYVLYLDLVNAYNATNMQALFTTLCHYGVPRADVDMLKACQLARGVKQGDVTSPLLFAALINLLLRMLQDSGCGYACTPPDGDQRGVVVLNGAFADDTFCSAKTAGAMQTMVDRIAEFSKWTGIHVHIKKSEITAYDYGTNTALETGGIRYMGHPFAGLAPDQPFKFLGVCLTLTGEWQHEKRYIWKDHRRTLQTYNCTSTSELQYLLRLHPFSHPSSMLTRIVAASKDIRLDVQDTVRTDAPSPLEFPDGHGLAATIHPLLLRVCQEYLQYFDYQATCTATVRGPGAGAPIRCIRDERPEDEETQRQWQESRDINRCLTWLGLRGIVVVEQLLVAPTGHWPTWTAWQVGNQPPRRGYDLLLAALTSATTADQRREWST